MKFAAIARADLILVITAALYSCAVMADQTLIDSTCKNTPNYQLCVSVLKADPKSATADLTGLATILVEAVRGKTNQAVAAVNRLRAGAPPRLSQGLKKCQDVYNAVLVGDIPVALNGLRLGNPKFAETAMADAVLEADTCEDAVGAAAGKPSPLIGVNKAVRDVGEVARAVIRNLL